MNDEKKLPESEIAAGYSNPEYMKYVKAAKAAKPKREYSALEVVFVWLCFVMGYLFCRVFPVVQSPFGGFLFVILLFGVTVFVLLKKGVKFGVMPCVMAA
ncbi:MAG: hypothetical protein IJ021_10135, partial [Clostridia bacterium]|nr:hypothetical protein [Clostridia bacterium]